jgi:DNA-binding MarR family transcriptional regulator
MKYVNNTVVNGALPRDAAPAAGYDPETVRLIELFFFAYRDFVAAPDELLARQGFGRAHHRVLHFVNRNPGLTVAETLEVLKITKQSLARVLKELVEGGYVESRTGERDRRQRLLFASVKGADLAHRLAEMQSTRIRAALEACGAGTSEAVEAFLFAMIDREDRGAVARLVGPGGPAARPKEGT